MIQFSSDIHIGDADTDALDAADTLHQGLVNAISEIEEAGFKVNPTTLRVTATNPNEEWVAITFEAERPGA